MNRLIYTYSLILLTCLYAGGLVAQSETTGPNWVLGATKGYAWLQGEVTPVGQLGMGLFVQKPLGSSLSLQLEVGMGSMRGLDKQGSENWLKHPVWNGSRNPRINYHQAFTSAIYANYKTDYQEASMQARFRFTQLPVFHNHGPFDAFLLGGIGLMRYRTYIDAASPAGLIYDFGMLDIPEETESQRISRLHSLLDGRYETAVQARAAFTPLYQFGAGFSWGFTPNFSLSISHRISVAGTPGLDSYQWDAANRPTGRSDVQHLTSLSLGISLFKKRRPRPAPLPQPPLRHIAPPPPLELPQADIQLPHPLQLMSVPEFDMVVLTEEEEEVVRKAFDNLEFETGRALIRSSSFASLNELASLMQERPNWKLRIHGHTDNVGDAEANRELAQRRAEAVKAYLVDRGLDPGRIFTFWYGETRPIATNDTPEGRQKNRRVELEIVE